MLLTKARGCKVVSTASAGTVGKVADLVVDAAAARVVAVVLKRTDTGGDIVPWEDIAGFGADALTVRSSGAIVVADETVSRLRSKDHAVMGKRVLDTNGDRLGKVKDIDFDPEQGLLRALVVGGQEVAASRLVASGPYAVIVRP